MPLIPIGSDRTTPLEFSIPTEFSLEDEEKFLQRIQYRYGNAMGLMYPIHKKARINRKIYEMRRKVGKSYDDEPDVTTPLTHDRTDELIGQMIQAANSDPLFTHESGNAIDANIARIQEAYMQKTVLRSTEVRNQVLIGSVKAAAIDDTAIGTIDIVKDSLDQIAVVPKIVSVTKFFTDNFQVNNLHRSFCGTVEEYPIYQLQEMADAGLIDPDSIEKVRNYQSTGEYAETSVDKSQATRVTTEFDDENSTVDISTVWMRYKPTSSNKSVLYRCLYHYHSNTILSRMPSPFATAFDAPPLTVLRMSWNPGFIWGFGLVSALASLQDISDNGLYTHMKLNQLAANPPFLYRQASPFEKYLKEDGLLPGIAIPSIGTPRDDIHPLSFQNNGLALGDVRLANQLAEQATFSDTGGGGSRQTRAEFVQRLGLSQRRVATMLTQFSADQSIYGQLIWASIVELMIKPKGVVTAKVGNETKLIAYQPVDSTVIREIVGSIAGNDMSVAGELAMESPKMLTDGKIPGAINPDIIIRFTGSEVTSVREEKAEKYRELFFHFDLINTLNPEQGPWYVLRRYMELKGIQDWPSIIGDKPGAVAPEVLTATADRLAQSSVR